jgi:ornithine cyclodeaminase/alanine dehydrogenase-like protein (mu-crystallin family)
MDVFVRIGIIGAGRYAATHMKAFAALPDATVTAACRRDREALENFKREWGVPHVFRDYRELLTSGEVDAVTIITPPDTHFEIANLALEAANTFFVRSHSVCMQDKRKNSGSEQSRRRWCTLLTSISVAALQWG